MKPTLFILAAGMGSRYGGLKQLDEVGPSGETIMDYSVFDALRAGFGKLVFVIRKSFDVEFREKIVSRYEKLVPVEVVYQELDILPKGYTVDPERVKPWGTNHAIMMGENVIDEPFAVLNADDFYGKESFTIMAKALTEMNGEENHYCMVGYRLCNTLSESGSVSRGVCTTDENDYLTSIVERTSIERVDGIIKYKDNDKLFNLEEEVPVSMNLWGFTPDYFQHSNEDFCKFLDANQENLKSEYYIPTLVNNLISGKIVDVKVLDTPSMWFGVTYPEDKAPVVAKLAELTAKGEYPSPLWQ